MLNRFLDWWYKSPTIESRVMCALSSGAWFEEQQIIEAVNNDSYRRLSRADVLAALFNLEIEDLVESRLKVAPVYFVRINRFTRQATPIKPRLFRIKSVSDSEEM